TMRLTKRCFDLLKLLRAARWLTTGQVRRRFFPSATADAARKRLRKLTDAQYLVMYREHRMAEALFTLGRLAKRALEKRGAEGIRLLSGPRSPRIKGDSTAFRFLPFSSWPTGRREWSRSPRRFPTSADCFFSAPLTACASAASWRQCFTTTPEMRLRLSEGLF